MTTHTEARQDLIADGAGGGGEIVNAGVGADEGGVVAAMDAAGGEIGDVDADEVHGNAPDHGTALAAEDRDAAGAILGTARGARHAIGVAERNDDDAGSALGRPGRAIADGLAIGDVALEAE